MTDLVPTEFTLRYDGERLLVDGPFSLPTGASIKVRVVETAEERVARRLEALRAFGELGRGGVQLEDRYLDDRETYYDDDHRAGLT